jgi:hypothetical protein
MRSMTIAATALALSACAPEPISGTTLPFFGDGYRVMGDQCRRIGEDDFTNQFLGDAADLVGCPVGMENLGVFETDTGATEVARKDGYVLYSVPTR